MFTNPQGKMTCVFLLQWTGTVYSTTYVFLTNTHSQYVPSLIFIILFLFSLCGDWIIRVQPLFSLYPVWRHFFLILIAFCSCLQYWPVICWFACKEMHKVLEKILLLIASLGYTYNVNVYFSSNIWAVFVVSGWNMLKLILTSKILGRITRKMLVRSTISSLILLLLVKLTDAN